ncbi:MAG: glycosyltransferase family 2 protein [Thermonemataceae bacterium]
MLSISVIIPSYNGVHKLPKVLESLEKQTLNNFEVIVVVDGSTDNTVEMLEQQSFKLDLKVIVQDNGGRAKARNAGAKAATGSLLLFFDDDMRLEKGVLEAHINHHVTIQKCILVGGTPLDMNIVRLNDLLQYKSLLEKKWVKLLQENVAGKPLSKDQIFLTAAHFSISKEVFWEINGFDEQLTDAEDYDLGVRAFKIGIPIYVNSTIIAWHDDFITCRSYIKRLRQYRKAHLKLKALKPTLYRDEFTHYDYNKAEGIKQLVYRFFAHPFWVNTIDHFNWLLVFPKSIRYKLYDVITTALSVHFPKVKLK